MSIFDIWKGSMIIKILLILVSFLLFSFGNTIIWIALGIPALLGGCFMAFRQGQGSGHEACGVSKSIRRVTEEAGKPDDLDPKLYKQAWNARNFIKIVLAGALVGYAINSVYIVCMLAGAEGALLFGTRFASWIATLPYWPVVAYWHETYDILAPDIVAAMMIGPFLIPLCQAIGYLQGPKLWAQTEKAMADGRRRAKARSRVVKKKTPRIQQPKI